MKAIILAAGYATRLYPLTLKKSKALLEINGKPIIDYIVSELNKIDAIDTIYVITNGLFAQDFCDWQKTATSKVPVVVVNDNTTSEETKLGAIGDINYCINEQNITDDTLIIAGDNFFDFALADFYNFHKEHNKDAVCVEEIDDIEQLQRFAVAKLDGDKIINLVEKPKNPESNTAVFAIYIYKKDSIALVKKYIEDGNNPDAPGYFLEWLYKQKEVYAYKIQGHCYDIGTLVSYEGVQKIVKENPHKWSV